VVVERGAGAGALIPDEQFEEAGARMTEDSSAPYDTDVVVKVASPSSEEIGRLRSDGVLIGFLQPLTNGEAIQAIAQTGVTSFAMEAIPRISRAQSMDALSSQANIAGYKSVLIASTEIGRFFPMLMTAAGTIRPATVLVLGAGVAGLQAIATARRLGAVVQGFDVRAAVKEQVQSLGAHFLEFDLGGDLEGAGGYAKELTPEQQQRQQELMAEAIGKVDVVITTALVPGRRAPILVTEDAVKLMKPGSVIVDLAGEAGGNCELSEPGETVIRHDVKILAPLNVPSTMAEHASQLYARNIQSLLGLMIDDEAKLSLDFEDEVIAGACITRDGEIVHEAAKKAAGAPA
jgi:H+-translocating NAD(P) transhydrogenase subunit alpha